MKNVAIFLWYEGYVKGDKECQMLFDVLEIIININQFINLLND